MRRRSSLAMESVDWERGVDGSLEPLDDGKGSFGGEERSSNLSAASVLKPYFGRRFAEKRSWRRH